MTVYSEMDKLYHASWHARLAYAEIHSGMQQSQFTHDLLVADTLSPLEAHVAPYLAPFLSRQRR